MALHDFQCPDCGHVTVDHFIPVSQRASEANLCCAACGVALVWIPQVGRMDALEPFQKFSAHIRQPDGSEKLTEIGSLSQMRRIERQSEQAARNGEGQQMVWRDYSNDRSNRERHTIMADPAETPQKSSRVRVSAVPESQVSESYGPGVGDHNTSALGE